MSPQSAVGTNPFLQLMNRVGSSGGGLLAQQRQMQFQLGMAHLDHQFGLQRDAAQHGYALERDAAQHEYDKSMAKTQGKQQRKTLRAQSAANMDRDTHQSGLKTQEAWEQVAMEKQRGRDAANLEISLEKRRRKLPASNDAKYEARIKREVLAGELARSESITRREELRTQNESRKMDMEAEDRRIQRDMLPAIMGAAFGGTLPGAATHPPVPNLDTLSRHNWGALGPRPEPQQPQPPATQSAASGGKPPRKPKTVAEAYREKHGL